jgi:tetratricopeptide (TPR) repeat protein
MKTKNIINLLLLCFTCNLVPAQELVYDTISAGKSVVCSLGETDACVTIIADKSLELGFRSSNEKLIDFMSNKENIGSQTHYYLHFKTTMPHNMNRKLEIFTKTNPNPIIIELEYLMPKQTLIFSVRAIPCYDPVFREGNKFFLAGQYQAARAEYVKAQSCFDVPPPSENELEKLLVQIDSIEAWIKIADESMLLLDYNTALTYYRKVISLNSFDQQTRRKRDAAIDKQSTHCKKCAKAAYRYYKEHEYEKALELSQLVVNQGCNDKQYYDTLIVKIHRIIEARKNKYRVFSYEFGISNFKNPNIMLPISFSIGKYLDQKVGGYFSFCTNPAFFNMLRSNYSKAVHADIGISFGLNFRPIKP